MSLQNEHPLLNVGVLLRDVSKLVSLIKNVHGSSILTMEAF